ncbi:MAG: DNA-directed RNA polymerase subunit beta [Myxococcales bacterium]|nr:MAG: DNA-directed RNA polymerase subunit beta [Myxococcales bacterium]
MAFISQRNTRFRRDFAKIAKIIDLPKLIEIQKRSYQNFLQLDVSPEKREAIGLEAVFKSIFPIKDFNETSSLEYVNYTLDKPKYDVDECRQRGMTFAAPMKVLIRLVVWDKDEESGTLAIRNVKEQEVYFGEIPLMTVNGTFIINGTERVIVSQLHRSPGAFFDHDKGKTHSSGKVLYSARIIPYRGSWLDFEFDPKDLLYVRIDRRRKLPATVLLRALGHSTEDLLDYFYEKQTIVMESGKAIRTLSLDLLVGQRASREIRSPDGEILVKKGKKVTRASVRKMKQTQMTSVSIDQEDIVGMVAVKDIVDPKTGEVVVEANGEITEELLEEIRSRKIKQFDTVFIDNTTVGPYMHRTLQVDKIQSPDEAIMEIYRRMRPGDPPTEESARRLFHNLFFNAERYDLSRVGRLKMNYKFGLNEPLDNTTLTTRDIMETVKHLIELRDGRGMIDDIDHLGNRRVRAVGELLENQYRIGLVRMERAIKERMTLQEIDTLMPHDLVNSKPVSAVVKEFFGSSQLSQFMDQTNPLSEVTHKRRLSALGPGGLTRERAGFEVRDVHATHYGRICPIETPEGPNIGLIASLSTYARVNEFGFIETPYRKAKDGRVTADVGYYSALEEGDLPIAQANTPVSGRGHFTQEYISCRQAGEFVLKRGEEVALMDVSPNQLVSVAASLIPFLENDDANRALMGSNMQRQAVPLLTPKAPLVGTGIEPVVARDSGVTCVARRPGVVDSVDATRIVVRVDPSHSAEVETTQVDIYTLVKYQRSNQNTCINQVPIVKKGDIVRAGDVLADGPATEAGELALGQNVLVAFMPWGGYNFEDSILVSERMLIEDTFTSIHIEEFETVARDTKLGKEEITRDIPNVGDEALKDLDESGIVRIGAETKPGDILVGKITPKGETQLSPEEKLLRAIFGEKAGDVRDTSLRVPPGVTGIVIDARVFSRKGVEKDARSSEIEEQETNRLLKDQNDQIKIVQESTYALIRQMLVGKKVRSNLVADNGKVLLTKGQKITAEAVEGVARKYLAQAELQNEPELEARIEKMIANMQTEVARIKEHFTDKINRLKKGDELAPGIIKMVKVYVAVKRKLSVGDKMAGRHGNKGVVSRVLPVEDMPFLPDGRPVDIVLNPLGVPSRMNVGQILETHLGLAARGIGEMLNRWIDVNHPMDKVRARLKDLYRSAELTKLLEDASDETVAEFVRSIRNGVHMASPVFDGAPETDIHSIMKEVGYEDSGQTLLYDGRRGERFYQDVTVGVLYMLKLHHLVDDKIHARSIGPYSLVTQQPLGGKAQFGGQRLGEMEVWAMEAYGAAHALQEFLTVKSDDVIGRTRMYEAIVKGEHDIDPGVPESFNVLIKELQSLGLNVELLEDKPPVA